MVLLQDLPKSPSLLARLETKKRLGSRVEKYIVQFQFAKFFTRVKRQGLVQESSPLPGEQIRRGKPSHTQLATLGKCEREQLNLTGNDETTQE